MKPIEAPASEKIEKLNIDLALLIYFLTNYSHYQTLQYLKYIVNL